MSDNNRTRQWSSSLGLLGFAAGAPIGRPAQMRLAEGRERPRRLPLDKPSLGEAAGAIIASEPRSERKWRRTQAWINPRQSDEVGDEPEPQYRPSREARLIEWVPDELTRKREAEFLAIEKQYKAEKAEEEQKLWDLEVETADIQKTAKAARAQEERARLLVRDKEEKDRRVIPRTERAIAENDRARHRLDEERLRTDNTFRTLRSTFSSTDVPASRGGKPAKHVRFETAANDNDSLAAQPSESAPVGDRALLSSNDDVWDSGDTGQAAREEDAEDARDDSHEEHVSARAPETVAEPIAAPDAPSVLPSAVATAPNPAPPQHVPWPQGSTPLLAPQPVPPPKAATNASSAQARDVPGGDLAPTASMPSVPNPLSPASQAPKPSRKTSIPIDDHNRQLAASDTKWREDMFAVLAAQDAMWEARFARRESERSARTSRTSSNQHGGAPKPGSPATSHHPSIVPSATQRTADRASLVDDISPRTVVPARPRLLSPSASALQAWDFNSVPNPSDPPQTVQQDSYRQSTVEEHITRTSSV